MNSVHSEELGITITANMITRHNIPAIHLGLLATIYGNISVVKTGENFEVSSRMRESDRSEFAGLIHRLNTENKLNKNIDKGNKGPDNDGPKPTNPRGSGGKVVEAEFVEAMAA